MNENTLKESKLLKDTKAYNEDKLIKIEGKGQHGDFIYRSYLSSIRGEYNITITEACEYLGCSYTYFITRLVDKILHIRINTAARKLIFMYSNLYNEDLSDILDLLTKRILLNKIDFLDYVRKSTIIEQQYAVLTYDDFDYYTLDKIQTYLDIYNSKQKKKEYQKTIGNIIGDTISTMNHINDPVRFEIPNSYEMPEKFYSLKELKTKFSVSYDMEVYRMIETHGVRKFLLCNADFVRYNIEDFKLAYGSVSLRPKGIFKIDYASYLKLTYKYGDVIKEIQKQAVALAIGLVK